MTSRGAFVFITTLFFFPVLLLGQISQPGTPPSFSKHRLTSTVPAEHVAPMDVAQLMAEDQLFEDNKDVPWRFGDNLVVNLNPENAGVWDHLPQGRLWRLGISSPGAYTLNLTFDRYRLPPGAQLYVYNADRSVVLGAFTDFNNQEDGYFATTLIQGDQITIEYYEPEQVAFAGELNLSMVTHAYRDPFKYAKDLGSSGLCNLNVACDEGQGWDDQINSVVMMVTGSNAFCTGTFINNTNEDATPYLLSANHCYKDPSTVVVWFNWQSLTCENPAEAPPYDSMSGAVDRAKNSTSDFWLIEMNHSIPLSYNPYFVGWNRTMEGILQETVSGIHHPRGDIKKFSYALEGVTQADYLGESGSGTSHWRVTWSGGTTTETGSSGSALLDSQRRLIGQLHGGYASCTNTEPDWYGRFGISWDAGADASTRLKEWLDPLELNPQVWDGLNPAQMVEQHTIALNASPPGLGEQTGGGTYDEGYNLTVITTVPQGYVFLHWAENGVAVSNNTSYSFVVSADRNLTAVFQPAVYEITVAATPEQAGTVTGGGSFEYGSQATAEAEPQEGWDFVHWKENDQVLSEDLSYTFQVEADRSLTAVFQPEVYELTVTADPSGAGTVSGGGAYDWGAEITLEALANEGWVFSHWSEGDATVSEQPVLTLVVTQNQALVAHFAVQTFLITVEVQPVEGGSASGTGTYDYDQTAVLSAQPASGWEFSGWEENATLVSSENPLELQVRADHVLTARMQQLTHTLTIGTQGEGTTNPAAGTYNYPWGDKVTMKAIPATGWVFSRWEVNGQTFGQPSLELEVTEDATAIAVFLDATSVEWPALEQRVLVFPSPASGTLNVRLQRVNGRLEIVLLNLSGQQVAAFEESISTSSEYQVGISLNGIPAGVYLLQVSLEDQMVHKKVIIY